MKKQKKYIVENWSALHTELNENLSPPCLSLSEYKECVAIIDNPKQSETLAIKAFIAFNDILTTARYCLLEGARNDHKMEKQDEKAQYYINLHNLKSAVVWYTSAVDYALQAIYWGFEFYSEINNQSDFDENLKKCYRYEPSTESESRKESKFYEKFRTLSQECEYAKRLYDSLNKLYSGENAGKIRLLTNSMKHHWGFHLDEVYCNPKQCYDVSVTIRQDAPAIDTKNTSAVEQFEYMSKYCNFFIPYVPSPPIVKYQEIITTLANLHIQLIGFQRLLHETLGYDNIVKRTHVRKFTAKGTKQI